MSEMRDLVKLYVAMSDRAEAAFEEAREAWATGEKDIERAAMIRMNGYNRTCNNLAAEIRAQRDPTFSFLRIGEWLAGSGP